MPTPPDGGRHSWLRRAHPRSDFDGGSFGAPAFPPVGPGYEGGYELPGLGEGGLSPAEYGAWMAQYFAGQVRT